MIRLTGLLAALAGPLAAQELSFPAGSEVTASDVAEASDTPIATGPWADGTLAAERRAGTVTRQAWRIPAEGVSSLQLISPLREQLDAQGFEVLFACETEACGGFDFRFALPVLPPPGMQVNLADFRYLSAARDDVAVALLASPGPGAGFVQVTTVGPEAAGTADAGAPPMLPPGVQAAALDLDTALATAGRFVLEGLAFETGSATLAGETPDSLSAVADYLARYPDRTVALVGHTDSEGPLDANIALSRRRAAAVLERIAADYGTPRRQMDAQGMGYLAPRASNLTEEGRALNRRVEVIVTSTE